MTFTISVRFSSAPAAPRPDRTGQRPPLVSIRHGRATAVTPAGAPGAAAPAPGRPLATAGRPAGAGDGCPDTAPASQAGTTVSSLLALAEPAALLVAEAAGLGLLGKVLLATAMRTAQRAIAS